MTRQRRLTIAAVVVWAIAAVLPASTFLVFDGLPFSSMWEVAALVTVVLACASGRSRALISTMTSRFGSRALVVVVTAGLLVAIAKLALLAFAPIGGFEACYSTPVAPRTGGGCELSYENLFGRDDATRFDAAIDFGPRQPPEGGPQLFTGVEVGPQLLTGSDWNLSFSNELRLNSIERPRGELNVARLPFEATWQAMIESDDRGWIPIRYVGEGRVRIDRDVTVLQPSYGRARDVFVRVGAGEHSLRISYRFDDRQLVGTEPRGPYATLRVAEARSERAPDFSSMLEPTSEAIGWRMLGVGVDVIFLAAALACLGAFVAACRASWRWLVGAALIGLVALLMTGTQVVGFAPPSLPIAAASIGFVVVSTILLTRRVQDLVLIGCLGAIALAVERVLAFVPDLHAVLFRPRGQDSLSYEWFARQILEHGSLEAGEKVFFYQPGFRYWVFGGHALFGDGDALPSALGLALVLMSIFLMVRWTSHARTAPVTEAPGSRLLIVVTVVALIVAITSEPIAGLIVGGASEYPTWFLIPLVVPLLFGRPGRLRWSLGTAALAATVVFRPNQGIAAIFLIAVFAIWQWRRARRDVVLCLGVFVGILLLPAVHNLWFGGELELLPTGASTVNDLPIDRLFDIFSDNGVRTILRDKLAALLYLTPREHLDAAMGIAVLTIQVAWLTCVIRAFRRRATVPWYGWCLLAWPLVYALPHVSFDVYIYYPRHIVAIYVAAAVAVVFVETRFLSTKVEQSCVSS